MKSAFDGEREYCVYTDAATHHKTKLVGGFVRVAVDHRSCDRQYFSDRQLM